ncbi:MAG: peptidylprolyl isomerase [Verrucomicrobiales bacterium]|nr:peptidylprolyl isomerase [Verrucomicrobiales bacterium]
MHAQTGKRARVEFTGRTEAGTLFAEAPSNNPLEFTLGNGEVLAGFEEAVLTMEAGEHKTVSVPPEKGFGSYDEKKQVKVDREQITSDVPLEVGRGVQMQGSQGKPVAAHIKAVDDASVTLDLNHPLAGKTLEFDIRLLEVA